MFEVIGKLLARGYPSVEYALHRCEKEVIKKTAELIRAEISTVAGVKTYLKLFQTYSTAKVFIPSIKESPMEDLYLDQALNNHGLMLIKVSLVLLLLLLLSIFYARDVSSLPFFSPYIVISKSFSILYIYKLDTFLAYVEYVFHLRSAF